MNAIAERLLDLAREEIGTTEQPSGSNCVKYNTAYYGREVRGPNLAWCAVFVWWLFQKAGVSRLYYNGGKTAYVPALVGHARRTGRIVDCPRAGDLVCFDFNGNGTPDHIGICEAFDGRTVTTIDGNTGNQSESNGGAVLRRFRDKKYIAAVIRPAYEEVEEVTQEEFDRMMDEYLVRQSNRGPSDWSAEAREWAEKNQIISGDEQGRKQYKKFCTREELVQILYNAQIG